MVQGQLFDNSGMFSLQLAGNNYRRAEYKIARVLFFYAAFKTSSTSKIKFYAEC